MSWQGSENGHQTHTIGVVYVYEVYMGYIV